MMTMIMDCNVSTEVKFYSNEEKGTQVAHFNVAYNQGKNQPPMFFQATVFGKNALTASKYIKVGTPLLIRCQLKPVSYQRRESNVEVQTFELIINEFKMLSSGRVPDTGAAQEELEIEGVIIE